MGTGFTPKDWAKEAQDARAREKALRRSRRPESAPASRSRGRKGAQRPVQDDPDNVVLAAEKRAPQELARLREQGASLERELRQSQAELRKTQDFRVSSVPSKMKIPPWKPKRPKSAPPRKPLKVPAPPSSIHSGTSVDLWHNNHKLRAKHEAEGYISTMRGDLGHWYTARRPGEVAGSAEWTKSHAMDWAQPNLREDIRQMHYGSEQSVADLKVLEKAARGMRALEYEKERPTVTDYRTGTGKKHDEKNTAKAFKALPYAQASRVPSLCPQIWDKTRAELTGPKRVERSSQELAADLRRVRSERQVHEDAADKARDERIAATALDWTGSQIVIGFEKL